SILVAALASLALLERAPAAAAKAPCWQQIINDWLEPDQRINHVYPLHCYREAIAHVPVDLGQYTGIIDDINAASRQALRGTRKLQGRPPSTSGGTHAPGRKKAAAQTTTHDPDQGLFRVAFDKIGPRNADSMPLPLLILAGL